METGNKYKILLKFNISSQSNLLNQDNSLDLDLFRESIILDKIASIT